MWLALAVELALLTHAPRTQATPAVARTRTRSQFRAAAAPAAAALQPPEAQQQQPQPHTQSMSTTDTNDTREGETETLFMSGETGRPVRSKRNMVPSGDGTHSRTRTYEYA